MADTDNSGLPTATAAPSKDGGESVHSAETQTRFSFYNASDFIVEKEQQQQQQQVEAVRVEEEEEEESKEIHNQCNNDTTPTTATLPAAEAASSVSSSSNNNYAAAAAASSNSLDSIEILRSLQEHEQQRISILGSSGTPISTTEPSKADAFAVAAATIEPAVLSSTGQPQFGLETPNNKNNSSDCSDNNNPYEDAINEALLLLRKHRSPSLEPTAGDISNDLNNNLLPKTPAQADRLLQSRDSPWTASSNHSTSSQTNTNKSMEPVVFSPSAAAGTTTEPTTTAALGEAYQAEIEARRKQRQERMARYASRLAELKQETAAVGNMHTTATATMNRSLDDDNNNNSSPLVGMPTTGSLINESSQTGSVSTLSQRDEAALQQQQQQVQLGVERVLLAILDRANSRGRGPATEIPNQTAAAEIPNQTTPSPVSTVPQQQSTQKQHQQQQHQQDTVNSNNDDDDALLRAMSDLLRQSTSMSSTSIFGTTTEQQQHDHSAGDDNEPTPLPLGDASQATQDSDTLKAAADINDASSSTSHNNNSNNNSRMVGRNSREEHDELDRMVERVLQVKDNDKRNFNKASEDALDQRVRQVLSKDDDEEDDDKSLSSSDNYTDDSDDEYTNENDTLEDTLEAGLDEDDDINTNEHENESSFGSDEVHSGVLGRLSGREGESGVVLEAGPDDAPPKSLIDSISAAARNLVAGISPSQSEEDSSDSNDSSEEEESEMTDLMYTLCAHLLKDRVSAKKKRRLLARIPRWDESNVDEPGYRIIRLNGHQLKQVEGEYERISKQLAKISDASFEHDLQEAEKLLNGEQKKKAEKIVPTELWGKEVQESECLVDFPGVKPAGRGEMGELEYFHLPIVFKSHVTGFEPTKDIYLEAGNIVAGQYLVEGELGSAAFSTAYRCIDLSSEGGPDDHEEVCLKIIKNTKDFFDQSLDEIKILELLRQTGKCHEHNILEMKTFFYHREHLIIVTELLRQNLFEFGKFITDNDEEPYFTIQRLSYLTRQILIALDFVHRIGLVHSDVKPENILLSSYSRARTKLIDFGSSCYLTDRQSSYIQSRSYRAPEVILGLPYDGRIDVWSLGCVVAEMFTGEVTFQNDSVVSMLSRIEAICGKFPDKMTQQGRQSAAFYTASGLLYEKIKSSKGDSSYSDDESSAGSISESSFDVFQPKRTTMAARLGFEEDLLVDYLAGRPLSREKTQQAIFADFCRQLLFIDPEKRPTAAEALQHPWMEYAATLTEEDVKYPAN